MPEGFHISGQVADIILELMQQHAGVHKFETNHLQTHLHSSPQQKHVGLQPQDFQLAILPHRAINRVLSEHIPMEMISHVVFVE